MAITILPRDTSFGEELASGFSTGFDLASRMNTRKQQLAFQERESRRKSAVDRAMGKHRADTLQFYKDQAQDASVLQRQQLILQQQNATDTQNFRRQQLFRAKNDARLKNLSNIHGTAMQALNYESSSLSDQGGGLENTSMVDSRLMAEAARLGMIAGPDFNFNDVYSSLDATPRNILSKDDISNAEAARILLTSGQGYLATLEPESQGQVIASALAGEVNLKGIKYKPDATDKYSSAQQSYVDALLRGISGGDIGIIEGITQLQRLEEGKGIQDIQVQKQGRVLSASEFTDAMKVTTNIQEKQLLVLTQQMRASGQTPTDDEIQVIDINPGTLSFEKLASVPYTVAVRMVALGKLDESALKKYSIHNKSKTSGNNFGTRPDGTQKGNGWLGVKQVKGGGVATEYSTQSDAVKVDGKRIDFPSLVPGLSDKQIKLMVEDIIPNHKSVPQDIMQIAVDHANRQLSFGRSVWKEEINSFIGRTPFETSGGFVP